MQDDYGWQILAMYIANVASDYTMWLFQMNILG